MGRVRFRIILPIIFGFAAAVLFGWEYENDRVVAFMGMAWDLGPRVWPYRAVPSIAYALNAPAYVFSQPILRLLDLRTYSLQYVVCFPVIVFLWWLIGVYFDYAPMVPSGQSWPKLKAGILFAVALIFVFLAILICADRYSWVRDYWSNRPPLYALVLLSAVGSALWSLFFATVSFRAAIGLVRREAASWNPLRVRTVLMFVAAVGINVAGVSRLDRFINPPSDPNHCETDRLYRLGCVHGTVIDEEDKPVRHIEVNLIPTFKSGDARRFGTKDEWTDQQGRYDFNGIDSGDYILAVNPSESSGGPGRENPFETGYYREAKSESAAERVTVRQPIATNLSPLKLRSSKFATIRVFVEWRDGSHPRQSDIFVQNTHYPGVLGGFGEVEDGVGRIDLAEGHAYVVNAQVKCDGGDHWNQRLATPSPEITVAKGQAPADLHLVLLGAPCVLKE